MSPTRAVPAGVWRDTGSGAERARVAFGESPGINGGAGPGGTRTDRLVFFGLMNRRTRGWRGPLLAQPAIAPTRLAVASSANTRQSNEALSMRAVLLFTFDVAAAGAGVETTGVGMLSSGVPATTDGTHQSAKHAHSTCNGVRSGSVHPNGVRMIRFPGQAKAIRRSGYYRIQSCRIFGLACRNLTLVGDRWPL